MSVKFGKKVMLLLFEGFMLGMWWIMMFEGVLVVLFLWFVKICLYVGCELVGEMCVLFFGVEGVVMVFNDGDGWLELNFKDGKKCLIVWDK